MLIYVDINVIKNGRIRLGILLISSSMIDKTNAPKLAIRYKKKEYSNILLSLIFLVIPPKMVVPLRLIPGNKAML